MDRAKAIAIVGGGFAGTTLARALDGKLPSGYELVLVSEESYTTFNPMLPEAVGASIFPERRSPRSGRCSRGPGSSWVALWPSTRRRGC